MPDIMTREQRSERMSRVRNKDSKPETRVRSLLHRLGFRFRLHAADLPGKPDIVLRRHAKVILMHGCYWHRHGVCRPLSIPENNPDFWRKKFAENASRLARPDDEDLPSGLAEGGDLLAIAADVVLELPGPEVRAVRGDGERPTDALAMPIAAVHQDDLLVPGQDDIGLAGQFLVEEPETEAETVGAKATGERLGRC